MATTTWKITTLERELADGYVKKVIYNVIAEDGTYKFTGSGELLLPKPDTLVPYADLTEETVVGWVKAKLEAEKAGNVARIEEAVVNGVNEQKTPTTGVGKPWS